jgi:Putative transposase
MSRVLRGKMMARLRRAYRADKFKRFSDFRDPQAFARLIRTIAKLPWYVYAKPSFSRSEYVLQYLGRYTHRVGLANSRLLSVTDTSVTFRTKGNGTETLPLLEFLRRFLLHVLPDHFHKIRHIGLYANREKRARAHKLLGTCAPHHAPRSWSERLLALTRRDVSRCPSCQAPLFSIALPAIRAPPEARR